MKYLIIRDNEKLTNLDGLSGLNSIVNDLIIQSNLILTNLDGLSGLTSIGNDLRIQSNLRLTNLDGLSGLTSIGNDLTINFNEKLSSCAIPSICNLLANGGTATINNNQPNSPCQNKAAVETACICPNTTLLHVDSSATAGGDGSSWAMAFDNLQAAIDTACSCDIDTIWVAKGTYYPSKDATGNANPSDNRDKTFYINKDLQLYGGFPNTGNPIMADRDW